MWNNDSGGKDGEQHRIEIFGNQSVHQELLTRCTKRGVLQNFTLQLGIYGKGESGAKMGDAVWPEENFFCVVYCSEEERDVIAEVVVEIRKLFPHEGIKMFSVPQTGIVIY